MDEKASYAETVGIVKLFPPLTIFGVEKTIANGFRTLRIGFLIHSSQSIEMDEKASNV